MIIVTADDVEGVVHDKTTLLQTDIMSELTK